MTPNRLPLLPLLVDDVPSGLLRALAQEGVPVRSRRDATAAGRFVLFDSRRTSNPAPARGQTAIDVHRLRGVASGDPLTQLGDGQSRRQCWGIGGFTLCEEVARVNHASVRQRVLGRLREEIEQAGGVWLTVAAWPFPHRSAMSFRIDYDQYDSGDFDAMMDVVAECPEATSHFVNGAAYERHPEALARLRGLDVGSHGYRHHTYPTEPENVRNIGRGIDVLQAVGIEPSGFVAPGGRFNPGLLAAVESLGIGHSSEFALAYDDRPFMPAGSRVLQIPVHPICLGLFLEALPEAARRDSAAVQRAVRATIDHFRQTARLKYRAGEPIVLYGHPTGRLGRYPQVLRAVFDTADEFAAVWKTSFTHLAAWWRTRMDVRLMVTSDGRQFQITADRLPLNYRVAIEYWRSRHVARMPLTGRRMAFVPTSLAYENRTAMPTLQPSGPDRSAGLRDRFRKWLDWEKETPPEEIALHDVRHWAKRTLRKLAG